MNLANALLSTTISRTFERNRKALRRGLAMIARVHVGEISGFPDKIDDLEEFLRNNLPPAAEVSREGNNIEIQSEEISKRRIRFLVRKYMGRSGIDGFLRLIADGKENYRVIYRKIEEF
ncbi:MAG: 60S ribosomal protein L22 [Candidatus Thorarchaeota archaeon]